MLWLEENNSQSQINCKYVKVQLCYTWEAWSNATAFNGVQEHYKNNKVVKFHNCTDTMEWIIQLFPNSLEKIRILAVNVYSCNVLYPNFQLLFITLEPLCRQSYDKSCSRIGYILTRSQQNIVFSKPFVWPVKEINSFVVFKIGLMSESQHQNNVKISAIQGSEA